MTRPPSKDQKAQAEGWEAGLESQNSCRRLAWRAALVGPGVAVRLVLGDPLSSQGMGRERNALGQTRGMGGSGVPSLIGVASLVVADWFT